jgi:hypothetical protein
MFAVQAPSTVNFFYQAITRFDRWSMSDMGMLRQL